MAEATVTRARAARILGTSPRSIDRMRERGELEGEKDDAGEWRYSLDSIKEAKDLNESDRQASPEEVALDLVKESRALAFEYMKELRWLLEFQRKALETHQSKHAELQQEWANALRQEAEAQLNTTLALRHEDRKDKMVDELAEHFPGILKRGIEGRVQANVGAALIDKLVALGDDEWKLASGFAKDLLGLSDEQIQKLEEVRASKTKTTEKENVNHDAEE